MIVELLTEHPDLGGGKVKELPTDGNVSALNIPHSSMVFDHYQTIHQWLCSPHRPTVEWPATSPEIQPHSLKKPHAATEAKPHTSPLGSPSDSKRPLAGREVKTSGKLSAGIGKAGASELWQVAIRGQCGDRSGHEPSRLRIVLKNQ